MNRFLKLGLALAASLALVPLVGSLSGAASAPLEAQFLAAVNGARVAQALAPLAVDTRLVAEAQSWSDRMLAAGALSENPNVLAAAPPGTQVAGENAGEGTSVDQMMQSFMNSPEHRDNILGSYDAVGIGVDRRADGMLFVTMDFAKWQAGVVPAAVASAPAFTAAPASAPSSSGAYYVLGRDGTLQTSGPPSFGSPATDGRHTTTIALALVAGAKGYDVLGTDGTVSSYGSAPSFGAAPGHLGVSTVDLRTTPSGAGYWILDSVGGVFTFGDAGFYGSLPAAGVHARAERLIPTSTGKGYWILGSDGGVFGFGDAPYLGSLPALGAHQGASGLAATPSGRGYWILDRDGGVFSFGDARYFGSLPGSGGAGPVSAIVAAHDGQGYAVLAATGRIWGFGDAPSWSGALINAVDLGAAGI